MSNPSGSFVADTSTVINLNATQCAAEILAALPERVVVVDIAVGELEHGRRNGRADADMLGELRKSGLVKVDSLGDAGEVVFEQLVAGTASETLDDGEAATIAYAVEHSLGIVVDDGKARRICRERYGSVRMRSSIEIFQNASLHKALGRERLVAAVTNALKIGRMRVLPEHIPWVVDLIGDQSASTCRCVASSTSGQTATAKMRDFARLLRRSRRSEGHGKARVANAIYGGAEGGDCARG